jgi:hypothetical protein
MCCFSGPVTSVSATKIFARMGEDGRQFLVYSMSVDMADPLAMVLPVPVKKGSGDDAVRFIDLKHYSGFFTDLESGFPKPVARHSFSLSEDSPAASAAMPLPVVKVGNFEASFVPTVKDFNRLDPRFQLPPELFAKMPDYQHFGFAVFKLKPGNQTVHPMAFDFPAAKPESIFFPTVHIHDGQVHEQADFDHVLYCQPGGASRPKLSAWKESPKLAGSFVSIKKSAGIVLPEEHCYKHELQGMLANTDTLVAAS